MRSRKETEMSYREYLDSSSDATEMGVGTKFFCVFDQGEPNERSLVATITEIEFDGDVDDDGRGYGYVAGATAVLDDGRTVYLGRNGMGDLDGEAFDSQVNSSEFYAALDAFRAGGYLTLRQKGLLIGAIELKNGYVSPEQVVEIAKIIGNVESFRYFDGLAGSGGRTADEYGAYKVRQARNATMGGRAIFFDALQEVEQNVQDKG